MSYFWRILFFVGIVVIWQEAVVLGKVPSYILPTPLEIGQSVLLNHTDLLRNIFPTLYESVVGFAVGSIIGIGLGSFVVYSEYLRTTMYPLLVAFNSFPKIAIAPILLVWFGLGLNSKIAVSVFIAFFPVFINSTLGLGEVDPNMVDLVKTMGARQLQIFLKIRFPNALRSIFDGLKIAMPLALLGAVVGEFVGSNEGLGNLLLQYQSYVETPSVFATLVFLILLSMILFYTVVYADKFVSKKMHYNRSISSTNE